MLESCWTLICQNNLNLCSFEWFWCSWTKFSSDRIIAVCWSKLLVNILLIGSKQTRRSYLVESWLSVLEVPSTIQQVQTLLWTSKVCQWFVWESSQTCFGVYQLCAQWRGSSGSPARCSAEKRPSTWCNKQRTARRSLKIIESLKCFWFSLYF